VRLLDEDGNGRAASNEADAEQRAQLPKGVEAFQVNGPLFFGAANRLDNLLDQFFSPPMALILRMRLVPFIDASGVHALKTLTDRCQRRGIVLILSGLQPQPQRVIADMHLDAREGQLHFAGSYDKAIEIARSIVMQASPA
jgi:SulP family sulfate permease